MSVSRGAGRLAPLLPIGLILIAGVLGLLLPQPARAERVLATADGLVIKSARDNFCSSTVSVIVEAPNTTPFEGDRLELQKAIGELRLVVGMECPRMRGLSIRGQVEGVLVFKGQARAADDWRLTGKAMVTSSTRARAAGTRPVAPPEPPPAAVQGAQAVPGCGMVDPASAEDVFRCMGTMRFESGMNIFQNNIGTSNCQSISATYVSELAKRGMPRPVAEANLPSCAVFGRTVAMLVGKPSQWSACTDWPGSSSAAHVRACLERYLTYYTPGSKPQAQAGSCDALRAAYDRALRDASRNRRLPEGFTPPGCEVAGEVVAAWTGGQPEWAGCADYTPDAVEPHLLRCLGSDLRKLSQYRTCVDVREAYERKLIAANGTLPGNYAMLSCQQAQTIIAKVEENRLAEAEAADRRRRADAEQRQKAAEEERRAAAEHRLAVEREAQRKREAELAAKREAEQKVRLAAQAPASPALKVSMEVTRCDELAAHPEDPARVAPGVPDDKVDWAAAAEACLAAYEAQAETPRIWFQLSRTLMAGGAMEDAAALLGSAAEAGHAASMTYLAEMTLQELGGLTKDEQRAMALYEGAAEGGYGPAVAVAAEWRPDMAMRIADFSAFERSDIIGDLYYGRFDAWKGQGRYTALRYVGIVHRDLSEKFLYMDGNCPLLVEGSLSRALVQATSESMGMGRMGEQGNMDRQIAGSMTLMMNMMTTMIQNPDAIASRAMDWDVLEAQATKDTVRLVRQHGCQHPVTRHFYGNLVRFVRGQEPQSIEETLAAGDAGGQP